MRPVISIIYVNFNTSGLVVDSIISLRDQCRDIPFEIIIVDNSSFKKEKEILVNGFSGKENVKIIFSETNQGFAKANNQGASCSIGKYLFFLNPDTLILNDVLKIFYNYLESCDQKIVACGGNLLNPDLGPTSSYGNFPGILLELCNIGLGLSFLLNGYYKKHVAISCEGSNQEIQKVPYIVGADLFINADSFNSLYGFDENYFMYYEETDLFLRLNKVGLEARLLPTAKIIHYEGGSIGKSDAISFNYNKFEILLRSKIYYYKKWQPHTLIVIKAIIFSQILVQYAKGKWGNDLRVLLSIYRKIISLY